MDVSRVFHEFQGCFMIFKSVSRLFQGSFQGVSKEVSCCMALIAASRAEGGLVFLYLACMYLFYPNSLLNIFLGLRFLVYRHEYLKGDTPYFWHQHENCDIFVLII